MPKTYTITAENSKELREAMKDKNNSRYYAKLQSVALRGEGKDNKEIGPITGYHPSYVSHLVSIYCNEGLGGLCKDERTGGNNQNMSDEEAEVFLKQFEESAEKGEVITVATIAAAYDDVTGRERESKSTIYSFLHKYGWRLVTPRPKHPEKASDGEIETSKKT